MVTYLDSSDRAVTVAISALVFLLALIGLPLAIAAAGYETDEKDHGTGIPA
jgi:hypothetical protein